MLFRGEGGFFSLVRGGSGRPKFIQCLDDVRQTGGGLLISGDVSTAALQRAFRSFFGDETLDRRRVLVLLEASNADQYLPGDVTADAERVRVVRATGVRSTAAAVQHAPIAERNEERLRALRQDVDDATDGLRPPGGYQAGQLRVALVSLQPLLDGCNDAYVFDWLERLYDDVTAATDRGRLYVAYPNGPDEAARVFEEGPFDIHVKLRQEGDRIEQQWVVPAARHPDVFDEQDDPVVAGWFGGL